MPLLRPCSPALALALNAGLPMNIADLFIFTLLDGTILRFCAWDYDLTIGGDVYSSAKPWLTRSKWNVTNTMQVPSLTVFIRAQNDDFNGGTNIKKQAGDGLFDGAQFLLSRLYIPAPIPITGPDTTTYGTIDLFGGNTAGLDIIGTKITLSIKGMSNLLDQYAPRNIYQVGCNHAFCDLGCTLNRATFTASYTMGATPTDIFVPWSGAAPGNYLNYTQGTLAATGGPASGQRRTVVLATTSGLTLAYPFSDTPLTGDAFTAFEGCDKTFNSGTGQSCTDRANTDNYDGYEFVPPPTAAI